MTTRQQDSKWRELVVSLVVSNSLFWYYIKQIMNVFIRAMVRIFASLNGTFHLSPHENILTIALINIHYLYNITITCETLSFSHLVTTQWLSLLLQPLWDGNIQGVSKKVYTSKISAVLDSSKDLWKLSVFSSSLGPSGTSKNTIISKTKLFT